MYVLKCWCYYYCCCCFCCCFWTRIYNVSCVFNECIVCIRELLAFKDASMCNQHCLLDQIFKMIIAVVCGKGLCFVFIFCCAAWCQERETKETKCSAFGRLFCTCDYNQPLIPGCGGSKKPLLWPPLLNAYQRVSMFVRETTYRCVKHKQK